MVGDGVRFNKVIAHVDRKIREIKEKKSSERFYGLARGYLVEKNILEPQVSSIVLERVYGDAEGLRLKILYTHSLPKNEREKSYLSKMKLSRRVQVAIIDVDQTKGKDASYCSELTQICEDKNGYAYRGTPNSDLPEELRTREHPLQSIDDVFAAYISLRSANQIK